MTASPCLDVSAGFADDNEDFANDPSLIYCEYAKAQPLEEESLQILQKILGKERPETATSLGNLGELYREMGKYAKAEPLLKEALRIYRKVRGEENPDTAISLNNLAELYRGMGEYAKAEPLLQEALRIFRRCEGRNIQTR